MIDLTIENEKEIFLEVDENITIGGEGTNDYNLLINKPTINGVKAIGEIEVTQSLLFSEIDEMFKNI